MRRAALALSVVPLALVACGGGGSGGKKSSVAQTKLTPIAYVKSSAAKTTQVPSEHVSLAGTASVAGSALDLTGEGDFDNRTNLGKMHATFSASGLSGALDEILSGTTVYLKSPLLAGGLPKGKEWMKLDLRKAAASQGADLSSLISQNPDTLLTQIKAAGKVTTIGNETVAGASTTHYRVVLDPSKLPEPAIETTYAPADVWIGTDDGYVHKLHLVYSVVASASTKIHIDFTTSFSKFGTAVDIAVPSAASSFDTTGQAIKGLGG